MIIAEHPGDIFACTEHTLVCPVNTVGVMGNGLALAFKLRYPGLESAYKHACAQGLFRPSGFVVWSGHPLHKVVCLATKRHWVNPSRIEWIEQALQHLADSYEEHELRSLALPAIGCGKGQLAWAEVRPLIYRYFEDHPLPVEILCPPESLPAEQ